MSTTSLASARWTVTVTKETDVALRSFLRSRGRRKGDLSKFIEEAVRWRMFDLAVQQVRVVNADRTADELQALIDEACAEVRADRSQSKD